MKVVIIEDEQLAAERLVYLLNQCELKVEIVKHLFSIEESVQWLRQHPHPDLLFLIFNWQMVFVLKFSNRWNTPTLSSLLLLTINMH